MVKDLFISSQRNLHNLEDIIGKQKTVLSALDDHEQLSLSILRTCLFPFNSLLDDPAIADAKEEPLRRLYYRSGHDKWKSKQKSNMDLEASDLQVNFQLSSITEAFLKCIYSPDP